MRKNNFCALILIIFFASSCHIANKNETDDEVYAPDDEIILVTEAEQTVASELNEFIFIRIYDVKYLPKHFAWNALKAIIYTQGCAPNGCNYTHSAINLSLADDFVGISGCYGYDANKEIVQKSSTKFLQKLDSEKSKCTVIAIPCSKTDAENCKVLLDYVIDPAAEIKFSVGDIVKMPIPHKKNKRNIKKTSDNFEYTKESELLSKSPEEIFEPKKYNCSVFVSNVLYNSVAWFNEYVDALDLSVNGFTPNDFYDLAGTKLLFTCTFNEYNETARKFKVENPEFAKY